MKEENTKCSSCGSELSLKRNFTRMPKYNPDGEPKENITLCGECMLKITNGTIYSRLLLAELPKESIEELFKGLEWINKNRFKILIERIKEEDINIIMITPKDKKIYIAYYKISEFNNGEPNVKSLVLPEEMRYKEIIQKLIDSFKV